MGRLFARLFKKGKHRVIIFGRDKKKTKRVAEKINVQAGDLAGFAKANIVIVSVPIENTVEVCGDVLQRMSHNTLLVEVSSVKTDIVSKITELVPPKIEYLSLHPLFGPSVRRFRGLNIVAIPVKRGWLSDRMISSLRDMGFAVETSSVEEHDKIMATLQVVHHYAYLVMAVELAKAARASGNFKRFLTGSLQRTLSQIRSLNEIQETVFSIQKLNPSGFQARTDYALAAQRLTSMDDDVTSEMERAMRVLEDSTKPRRHTRVRL